MDFASFKVVELKEILKTLKLKCTGSRVELLARIAEVDEARVAQVCHELKLGQGQADNNGDKSKNKNEDEGDDNESFQVDIVGELQEMVQSLAAEVKMLREANVQAATCQSYVTAVPAVTTAQSVATTAISTQYQNVTNVSGVMPPFTGQPCASSDVVPGQQPVMHTSQPIVVPSGQPFYMPQPSIMTTAQQYIPQPFRMTTAQQYMPQPSIMTTSQQYPTVWSMTPPQVPINTMHNYSLYSSNQRGRPTKMPSTMYASSPANQLTMSMQSASQMNSVKDVGSIIPTFDPSDETYTSIQFVERIEQLKEVYAWDDAVLVFAVLSKLKGVAKRWADAQPVFGDWASFVVAFLNDFPQVSDLAGVHIRLMNERMNRSEKFIEYYYKMLAIGRREKIDDMSIIRYIINGLYDENMKRTPLSVMQFSKCSDLLKAYQSCINVSSRQYRDHGKPWENKQQNKFQNEKDKSVDERKPVDVNKSGSGGIVCYKCRKRGHIARNCTQVRKINVNSEQESVATPKEDEVEINAVKHKNRNELLKNITIGVDPMFFCEALIDSGSGKTIIKKSMAEKVNIRVINCCEKLVGFAGGEIICKQRIQTQVKIDNVLLEAEMLVVDDKFMSHDVLIGLDILEQVTVII